MTRYPGLLDELAATKGEKKQIENILKKYPEEIRGYSLDYSVSHYGMIMSIYKISKDFETSFKNLVKTYPTDLQTAFQEISAAGAASMAKRRSRIVRQCMCKR